MACWAGPPSGGHPPVGAKPAQAPEPAGWVSLRARPQARVPPTAGGPNKVGSWKRGREGGRRRDSRSERGRSHGIGRLGKRPELAAAVTSHTTCPAEPGAAQVRAGREE
ncbi:unnamed protein product [Gulo gulo]|uniref:Uncharacterized protein n=1 Tax=Gulo gulo TaxID=48420 RepID=A0A9X9Q042_GULGU|nr:unnamed protein product [Gulo gulo]